METEKNLPEEEKKEEIDSPMAIKSWWARFFTVQTLLVCISLALALYIVLNVDTFVDDCNQHWQQQAEAKGWGNPQPFNSTFNIYGTSSIPSNSGNS